MEGPKSFHCFKTHTWHDMTWKACKATWGEPYCCNMDNEPWPNLQLGRPFTFYPWLWRYWLENTIYPICLHGFQGLGIWNTTCWRKKGQWVNDELGGMCVCVLSRGYKPKKNSSLTKARLQEKPMLALVNTGRVSRCLLQTTCFFLRLIKVMNFFLRNMVYVASKTSNIVVATLGFLI